MSDLHELHTARQVRALRYRMAQVTDLQRQRDDLHALKDSVREPLDLAAQLAKIDSALRLARLALAQNLQALPNSERLRFIKLHAHERRHSEVTPMAAKPELKAQ